MVVKCPHLSNAGTSTRGLQRITRREGLRCLILTHLGRRRSRLESHRVRTSLGLGPLPSNRPLRASCPFTNLTDFLDNPRPRPRPCAPKVGKDSVTIITTPINNSPKRFSNFTFIGSPSELFSAYSRTAELNSYHYYQEVCQTGWV